MKKELVASFQEVFGGNEPELFFAPGRVNLIGEHTDYNGGHVFPCALTIGTYGAARKNGEKVLRFYSLNFKELGVISVSLEGLTYDKKDDWANYPKGVIKTLQERGFVIDEGMDLLYFGNIPNASGLSSSASVEVLTGFIAKELFGLDISLIDIALVSQYAENNFIGVNCGIMDQFAIAMGKKDNAIFLDTSNLAYEYAPIKLENAKIVIACSNKKRGLGDSKYNERRQECEDALASLQTKLDIRSLGELTEEEFEKHKDIIGDPVRTQRAKHAVYENQRTVKAVKALEVGNITLFGELMNASHVSLRDDYEVTGIELDTLVEASWAQEGVIGARMTGAGFGGCTVSIVENANVDTYIENVGKIYEDKIGYKADFYVVEVGDGPVRL
ncbi:MAG: galactokinase [Anaerocolumna sp.]|jgi:galactokinase|nr:galactokinase [Anaerocolumna sp.]